jgi:hypothetical protein
MFPFDLSTNNTLLIAAVVALFIVFLIVLIKLNPSTEKEEEKSETKSKVEKPKPMQTPPPLLPQTPQMAKTGAPKIEKPQVFLNPAAGGTSVQTNQAKPVQAAQAPTRNASKPLPKLERVVAKKGETNNPSRRDCVHQFGHLRSLPKNAPIPDECFGCTQIVECLVNQEKKRG